MKKITILGSLLFIGFAFISTAGEIQVKKSGTTKNNDKSPSQTRALGASNPNLSPQSIIWSDDFSVAGNWTINSPTGSGAMKDWVIGTAGPSGSYAISKINSTTQTNGFGLFDSDKNCSTNQVANITNTTAISCTGHPNINLTFQQQYRRFYDSTFVFVSNNNTTWVKYVVNESLNNNDYCSTNPQLVKVNISATAGGQATVWIRFQFYSPNSLGSSAGCGYSWMIDDVALADVPANDISINRAYSDFNYKDGGYYTKTPKTQVGPVSFRSAVANEGTAAQTNVKLNVNISTGGSSVYNQNSSTIASFPSFGKDTLSITTAFTPPATVASYTTQFKISQTETELPADTSSNWKTKTFAVTDTVYARDNNVKTALASPNNYTDGDVDDSRIGCVYEFNLDAMSSSISVYVDSLTAISTSIQAKIYSWGAAPSTEIAASAVYNITTNANKAKWVTLPISTLLQKDSTYLATIVTTGVSSGTPNVYVYLGADKVTEQPLRTTFIYTAGGTPAWGYITTETPMIRLNIKPGFVGIKEISKNEEVRLYQNVPNPTKTLSNINYELNQIAPVSLFVYDVTGKKIAVQNEGIQNAGKHTITFNSENLSAGVYYYSLKVTQTNTPTMKMIVIK